MIEAMPKPKFLSVTQYRFFKYDGTGKGVAYCIWKVNEKHDKSTKQVKYRMNSFFFWNSVNLKSMLSSITLDFFIMTGKACT